MEQPKLEINLSVAEVLACWPQTIPVFMRHRMACIGCPIAPFETLAEVAAIYHLDPHWFLRELEQIIDQTGQVKSKRGRESRKAQVTKS